MYFKTVDRLVRGASHMMQDKTFAAKIWLFTTQKVMKVTKKRKNFDHAAGCTFMTNFVVDFDEIYTAAGEKVFFLRFHHMRRRLEGSGCFNTADRLGVLQYGPSSEGRGVRRMWC